MSRKETDIREVSLGYAGRAGGADVPSGYKRTPIGILPNEWNVLPFPDVCWYQEGPGLRHWQFKKTGMKVINVTNLENGVLSLERTDRHISLAEFRLIYQHFRIDSGDMVMASSGNSYGKTAVVRDRDLPLMMNTSVIRFKPRESLLREFLWAFINSAVFTEQIDRMITGGAQPNFGPYHLNRVLAPVPSHTEQRAIAEALSDVDGLLGSLDELIAIKRAIKQAAMQQLLTGKTRLPGFSGEWKTKRLGDTGTFSKGRGIKRDDVSDSGVPCIRYGELYTRYYNYITQPVSRISSAVAATALPIKHGALLFAGSGEIAAEIGKCAAYLGTEEAYAGGDIVVLTPREGDPLYLGHLMNHQTVVEQKARMGQGDAVVHISAANLAQIEVSLPPKAEQAAIATVLYDMDAEITALEQRRDKTRALKQGMMQQLLTGRIRLM